MDDLGKDVAQDCLSSTEDCLCPFGRLVSDDCMSPDDACLSWNEPRLSPSRGCQQDACLSAGESVCLRTSDERSQPRDLRTEAEVWESTGERQYGWAAMVAMDYASECHISLEGDTASGLERTGIG